MSEEEDDGFAKEFAELANEDAGQDKVPPADEGDDDKDPDVEAPAQEAPSDKDAATAETTEDLWENAPPALREAYERERTRAEAAETTVKRHSGRLSHVTHELNDLRATLASKRTGDVTEEGDKAKDREERMRQLREEYPEVAAPILDQMAEMEARISELSANQGTIAQAQSEDLLEQQLDILEQAHPTWLEDVKDPAFKSWIEQQPTYVRAGFEANRQQIVDGATSADILSKFKSDRAAAETPEQRRHRERREEQMEGGRTYRGKTPSAKRDGGGSFEDEFNRFGAEDRRREARSR